MDLNKALNHYQNPELEHYLAVKDIFSTKGFKIPTAFDFSKGFDKDGSALFYFFDFYSDNPETYLRIGINSIPIFFDDTLEITVYPSNTQIKINLKKYNTNTGATGRFRGILGIAMQKKLMEEIASHFKDGDSHYILRLEKNGKMRDKYESIIDSNQLSVYLQTELFMSRNFLKNNKDTIKIILDSHDLILHDFQLDNLLHMKILYYDGLNKKIGEFSQVKTSRDKELFLKSLRNDAIKRGKKLERVYLYTQKLLKKDQFINKLKDFTYFKFI